MSKDSTIEKCNFCFLAEELDSEKIEYWSRKMIIIHLIPK